MTMRERPILFSGPMVRALLAGTKTQTRRIVRPQPDHVQLHEWKGKTLHDAEHRMWWWKGHSFENLIDFGERNEDRRRLAALCPYGAPGDRLWVRETWQPIWADGVVRPPGYDEPEKWAISYPSTDGVVEYSHPDRGLTTACKPAIHMPRFASRITLEVTSVRVERLRAITEEDAKAEGVEPYIAGHGPIARSVLDADPGIRTPTMWRDGFEFLWNEISGAESWSANPWMWVVGLKRTEAPHAP